MTALPETNNHTTPQPIGGGEGGGVIDRGLSRRPGQAPARDDESPAARHTLINILADTLNKTPVNTLVDNPSREPSSTLAKRDRPGCPPRSCVANRTSSHGPPFPTPPNAAAHAWTRCADRLGANRPGRRQANHHPGVRRATQRPIPVVDTAKDQLERAEDAKA